MFARAVSARKQAKKFALPASVASTAEGTGGDGGGTDDDDDDAPRPSFEDEDEVNAEERLLTEEQASERGDPAEPDEEDEAEYEDDERLPEASSLPLPFFLELAVRLRPPPVPSACSLCALLPRVSRFP